MRNKAILLLAAILLAGCAMWPQNRSTQAEMPASGLYQLAQAATDQLASIVPPATTTLSFRELPPDPFGNALITTLRERGYGIHTTQAVQDDQARAEPPWTSTGMPFSYSIQQLRPSQYALTLMVGAQRLSCLFQFAGGTATPAGFWVRKE